MEEQQIEMNEEVRNWPRNVSVSLHALLLLKKHVACNMVLL